MRVVFLTSNIGGRKRVICDGVAVDVADGCDNTNGFVDRLRSFADGGKLSKVVCVASNPDGADITRQYAGIVKDAFDIDGFGVESLVVIDHAFEGDIRQTILDSDCVFLMGGHVPTQNKYLKEIGLKEILRDFDGIVIGQSAGSMNCSKVVYTQPEYAEEFDDAGYQRQITGLGLVDFAVMPHMNMADYVDAQGHPSIMQMCLEDSRAIPHYGIVDFGYIEVEGNSAVAHGETYLLRDGRCEKICDNGQSVNLNDYKIESPHEPQTLKK